MRYKNFIVDNVPIGNRVIWDADMIGPTMILCDGNMITEQNRSTTCSHVEAAEDAAGKNVTSE